MHWDSKLWINCSLQEKSSLLKRTLLSLQNGWPE
jgi:hypothetical protein